MNASDQDRALSREAIQAAMPDGGLFAGGTWRWSPEPLLLEKKLWKELEGLGHVLAEFQRASDAIYRRSAKGKSPGWIASTLDRGKPEWLVAEQCRGDRSGELPRVIRPDLLLTETGFSLTEIDSVPGGIGMTAWLAAQYDKAGFSVLGGGRGMHEGFSSVLPEGGAVAISDESADYRQEMKWLLAEIGGGRELLRAEHLNECESRPLYRFFELFDWKSIPALPAYATGGGKITAPFKAHLEEKAWLALFHFPGLRSLWQKELRAAHIERLMQIIPLGWLLRDVELPPEAALPGLGVNSWTEVMEFSQKERRLVLKISGFDETAWGSRGVFVGHDMPSNEWREKLRHALDDSQHCWMMQSFSEAKIIDHPVYQEDGSVLSMPGRVRLCPYYFTDDSGHTKLGGCLATIVPLDKKKIHGMSDGVLTVVGQA
jgi:hypothetical protein